MGETTQDYVSGSDPKKRETNERIFLRHTNHEWKKNSYYLALFYGMAFEYDDEKKTLLMSEKRFWDPEYLREKLSFRDWSRL